MKKIFAAIASLLLTASLATASAQAVMNSGTFGDFRLGLQLGMNFPTFGGDTFGGTIGYNFGVTGLYDSENFIPNSYVRASVLYTRKGASSDMTENDEYEFKDATYKLHYFEIPVRFGYAYELNDEMCIMGETGPYFAFRLWDSQRNDKVTGATSNTVVDTDGKEDMSDYDYDPRRFDVGWGIHAGVLFGKKYQVMAGYDWGMCNLAGKVTGDNRNFSINLAVYFD